MLFERLSLGSAVRSGGRSLEALDDAWLVESAISCACAVYPPTEKALANLRFFFGEDAGCPEWDDLDKALGGLLSVLSQTGPANTKGERRSVANFLNKIF